MKRRKILDQEIYIHNANKVLSNVMSYLECKEKNEIELQEIILRTVENGNSLETVYSRFIIKFG